MIKNLVISGGGVKIIGALGVIKYLDENNILKTIENYYGTSAGSILCLMLVLGFDSSEIIKFIEKFDLNKIFIINTDNIFTTFNICENNKLEKVIKLFINFKLGKISLLSDTDSFGMLSIDNHYENITMGELYKKTNKYLSITSVCLDLKKAVYISHETFPNIPVWKAILMSCSIPLIFKPVEWENKLYIDGGLIDNFPIFNINFEQIKYTLGIQIYLKSNDEPIQKTDDFTIYNYIFDLIKLVIEANTDIKTYNIISVKIDSSILDNFLNIDIDKNIKNKIINIGYEQTKIQFPLLFKNNITTSDQSTQTNFKNNIITSDHSTQTNFRNRSNSI
jgi:NTE family protein